MTDLLIKVKDLHTNLENPEKVGSEKDHQRSFLIEDLMRLEETSTKAHPVICLQGLRIEVTVVVTEETDLIEMEETEASTTEVETAEASEIHTEEAETEMTTEDLPVTTSETEMTETEEVVSEVEAREALEVEETTASTPNLRRNREA